jgi:puromycin-sensitive aminopeptidase
MPAHAVKPFRLPTDVRPVAYEVHLQADPKAPRFSGTMRLQLRLDAPRDTLVLHGRDLDVKSCVALQGTGSFLGSASVDKDTETLHFRFQRPLAAGEATLDVTWDAPVSAGMSGLYLSKDGPEECLVTQCEATDARAIFPCFDEPAFKAGLKWSVTAPRDVGVLANGPLESRADLGDGKARWVFAATPPIPSYLAAVAVGDFASTAEARADGVPHRVWAMRGKEGLGLEARDAAVRLQPWFAGYFGVPYRFGKYDQLAVPSFSFGAMENAGLVVFRASALLMDPRTASWRDRRHITLVVSHEFAHQWFGNHVTMAWWDDLWLNESFAEWVAHKAVDSLWPEHEVWIDFQSRTNGALATDSLAATHAIYTPVSTPAEAAEMFDAITYGKGSAVLRMLEAFLGDDAFRRGLQSYMQEFGGRNAQGDDLWRHLGKAADRPVDRVMTQWITQAGHPVVRVQSLGDGRFRLHQERFRLLPDARERAPPTTWAVPMVFRWRDAKGTHEQPHLLEGAEGEVRLPVEGALRWLHANAGDVGFYRTDPDPELVRLLVGGLDDLRPAERVGLLRDQWGLVRSGARPPAGLFELMAAAMRAQPHYAVADTAVAIARETERLLETLADERALAAYRAWVGRTFRPAFAAVGADPQPGEHPSRGVLRAALYRAMAGIARDPEAMALALGFAELERADPASVDANLAGTAVSLAAQSGDARRLDLHRDVYVARRDAKRPPQEVERYLASFASFRLPDLVGRTLAMLADGMVPKQSVGPLLAGLLREPHSQTLAWSHLEQHWDTLRRELGDSWASNLAEAAGAMPPARAADVAAFLDARAKDLVQSTRRAKAALDERTELFRLVVPQMAEWATSTARGARDVRVVSDRAA